jgi:hypothetical protein
MNYLTQSVLKASVSESKRIAASALTINQFAVVGFENRITRKLFCGFLDRMGVIYEHDCGHLVWLPALNTSIKLLLKKKIKDAY